jgi:hypothetical protein
MDKKSKQHLMLNTDS